MIYLIITTLLIRTTYQFQEFQCNTDYKNTPKSSNPFNKELKIFSKKCACEEGWKDLFCDDYKHYLSIKPIDAPTICICRKTKTQNVDCYQFMTKCYRDPHNHDRCDCCFEQPRLHCNQIECRLRKNASTPEVYTMAPAFENRNVGCVCREQKNYPIEICNDEEAKKTHKTSKPIHLPDFRSASTNNNQKIQRIDDKPDKLYYQKLYKTIITNKVILILVVLSIIGILIAIGFGISIICYGRTKNSRTTRRKQKDRLETEIKLLEIANNQDTDQYLP